MLKLMKLEMKKIKLGWYVRGAIIANILMIALICSLVYIEKIEGNRVFVNVEEAFIVIGSLVRVTFMVFAAVLIAKLVIAEYKNKTIFVMFTYPVSRKQLITAKLLIISGLTFMTIVISNVIVAAVFFGLNSYLHFIPGVLTVNAFGQHILSMIAFAFAATGTSLISLYFGMRKLSISATITSSIIIGALISQHNPAFSLASIIYIPLLLAVIGVIFVFWSIRNVEKVDVS